MSLLPLLFLACGGGDATTGECVDNGQCAEGQACVNEVCADVECLESSECDIGNFCDPRNYECRAGCEADSDCLAGQTCNNQAHICEDSACRSSELDCSVGEICDEVTGACADFAGQLCDVTCDIGDLWSSCPNGSNCEVTGQDTSGGYCNRDQDCDNGFLCDDFIVQEGCTKNTDCPAGATCNTLYGACIAGVCHQDHCMSTCNPNVEDSCPAGFSCLTDSLGVSTCSGECNYYLQNGYL